MVVFRYGVAATAVSGIGAKLLTVLSIVNGALATATASMVGQNAGAGSVDRVRKTVWTCAGMGLSFWVIVSAAAWFFPRTIYSAFTADGEVLELCVMYMHIQVLSYLGFTTMGAPTGLINGIGFTALNLVIALIDGVVCRIGFSLLLGLTFGLGLKVFFSWGSSCGVGHADFGIRLFFLRTLGRPGPEDSGKESRMKYFGGV